jgi:hypothetical protein
MTEEEKINKIKAIQQEYLDEIRRIEKDRDVKIKALNKSIDQREIDRLLQDLKK